LILLNRKKQSANTLFLSAYTDLLFLSFGKYVLALKMRKSLLILLAGFVLVYVIVRIAYHLPVLVHGLSQFSGSRGSSLSWMMRFPDLMIGFTFALFPYLALQWLYPSRQMTGLISLLFAGLVLLFLVNYYWVRLISVHPPGMRHFFVNNLFFQSVYFLYGVVCYFIQHLHRTEMLQTQSQLRSRESELAFLRSQINPHFLFNQLNTIYSLTYHGSDKSLEAISGLSDFLRYVLYDTSKTVSLEKEIVYIERYIELQRLRLPEVNVSFNAMGPNHSIQIYPLLFLPFIENAFKHGKVVGENSGMKIRIDNDGRAIRFYCENMKNMPENKFGGGIGLDNVKKRLALLYTGKYNLEFVNDESLFCVKLEIQYP
jgi:two-component system, LytTR family, sensor kinase